jgi:hypothetical protein
MILPGLSAFPGAKPVRRLIYLVMKAAHLEELRIGTSSVTEIRRGCFRE